MTQGLTAWHLLRTSARVQPGETVVVHAAAGGVGSLAVQLAQNMGACVIAVAGSPKKREIALDLGAIGTVDGSLPRRELAAALMRANGSRPVDVILDPIGGETFAASLDALAPFGRLIHFGMAGGHPAPPVNPWDLTVGSKSVQGFYNGDAYALPGGFTEPLAELLAMTADGRLQHLQSDRYPLEDAWRAHEDLLARRTTGKVVIAVK